MSYIGNSPGNASQRVVTRKVATAGQTRFASDSGYATGYVDVIVNGIDMVAGVDFNETGDGINIDIVDACEVGDNVKIIAWIPRGLSDGYTKPEANTLLAAKADLVNGTVPSSQLPSYVDDVLEYTNYASFPATGETGKIYVDKSAVNKAYRWSGSAYVLITDLSAYYTSAQIDALLALKLALAGGTLTGDLNLSGAQIKRTMSGDGTVFEIKGSYAGNPVIFSFGQSGSDGFLSVKDASGNETLLSGWNGGTSKFASKLRANNTIERQISFATGAETNIIKFDDGAGNYGGRIATYNNGGYYQDLRIYTTDSSGNNEKLHVVLDGKTRSLQTFGQQYATWTESVQTINGGVQTVRILEDCYGRWLLAGRFAADAAVSITGVWSSVRGLSTALDQNTTAFSADFGDLLPSEVRVVGATDWSRWRDTRTIDFIYKVPNGRPWKNFFNNNSTTGNVNVSQIARRGFSVAGSYDGFGRWNNPLLTEIGISDVDYACPTAAFTTPTSNAFDWSSVTGGDDAKLITIHSGTLASQDGSQTTGFGKDDGSTGFFDVYPNITNNMSGGRSFSSAVWILLKLN
jgi:hypothetical protein